MRFLKTITFLLLAVSIAVDGIAQQEEVLYPIRQNGKWGYMDRNGKTIVPPEYWAAEMFHHGYGTAMSSDGEYAIINKNGKVIAAVGGNNDAWSGTERYFSEGLLAAVNIDSFRYGYIDTSGSWVIPAVYNDARNFYCGRAMVSQTMYKEYPKPGSDCGTVLTGYYYGFIDHDGKHIIPEKYESATDYIGCQCLLEGNIADTNGKYVDPSHANRGILPTYLEYADHRNDPFFASHLRSVDSQLKPYREESTYLYGYHSAIKRIKMQFKTARDFSEGYAIVQTADERWGAIDTSGKMIVPPVYTFLADVSEGVVFAERDGRQFFMDKQEKIIIDITAKGLKAKSYAVFNQGLASLIIDNKMYYIDHSGRVVWNEQ